jgi:RNA polymerase sigma-70 factor (ECF subfamily)
MSQVIPLRPAVAPSGEPLASRPDDELMLLVRTGLAAALAALVERYTGRLTNYCAKLLGSVPIAGEVCQETWLRVWKHRASYRPEGKFAVFLYTTAHNLCKNHARDARRREHWLREARAGDALDRVADERPDHLDALLAREKQRDVHRALGTLPAPMREALLLRFQEDLSYEDMAAILDAPESTIRSRVHYGLKHLRYHLARRDSR